jgi:hypothetical protein
MTHAFGTKIFLSGELRKPRQMLAHQEYGGHLSIHDGAMADKLGFSGAPIEGPTHFSQFVPLLHDLFGDAWFERGCVSAHYQNPVVEGEAVRAFVQRVPKGATFTTILAEKADGTPVLTGTASVGPGYGSTELDERLARLWPPDKLVILRDLKVGQKGARDPDPVAMDFDEPMGALYPFSLNDKLRVITEPSPWYTREGGGSSPWGKAVIPLEMISVLSQYTSDRSGYRARGPSVGLFAGLEIKVIKGPLFVGNRYELERELVALSESKRTESYLILLGQDARIRRRDPRAGRGGAPQFGGHEGFLCALRRRGQRARQDLKASRS